jgi:hypothetical protein
MYLLSLHYIHSEGYVHLSFEAGVCDGLVVLKCRDGVFDISSYVFAVKLIVYYCDLVRIVAIY